MEFHNMKNGRGPPNYDQVNVSSYPPSAYPSDYHLPSAPSQGPYYGTRHSDDFGNDVRRRPAQMPSAAAWYNPRYWSRKTWIAVVIAVLVLLIIIIVAATVGGKHSSNSYPDYSVKNYTLQDTFSGENFFENFNYFTGYDPTHGFVHYVPQAQAQSLNLTSATADSATLKVDTTVGPDSTPDASTGRFSVRVESKKTWNSGLFLFDVMHTPYGCGTWPALWLSDPANWPSNGEIDVMESVNQGTSGNQMTLHTSSGCSMSDVKREQTFAPQHTNCDHSKNDNAGCSVQGPDSSYGQKLNDNDGALVAVEWRDEGIRMWQFGRSQAPADIKNKQPNPENWGTPAADFPDTDCKISNHFRNQSLIIDINLCGDLVYGAWDNSQCPGNCTQLVAEHPESFETAFWQFGAFQIYQAS